VATFALRSYAPEAPYRELAERTDALVLDSLGGSARATDLGDWPTPPDTSADDELALRAVVGWLAAPRRAGWCITVPDLARVSSALDLPGARTTGRRDALATLFHTAGRDGAIDQLLGALDDEAARAQAHYGQLATAWPAWADFGREWAAQVAVTRGFLARLRSLAEVALRP
jgi:hypothetical protein